MKNMDSKKIFFDTNILMEVVFKRIRLDGCINKIKENPDSNFISSLSVVTVNYFVEKEKGDVFESKDFIDDFFQINLSPEIVEKAYQIYNKDFEDAIQIASFLESDCDEFWTLDQKLKDNYGKIARIRVL